MILAWQVVLNSELHRRFSRLQVHRPAGPFSRSNCPLRCTPRRYVGDVRHSSTAAVEQFLDVAREAGVCYDSRPLC